jgi:hypothetical protein
MKNIVALTTCALLSTCAADGQGQFLFNTHDPEAGNLLTFVFHGELASGNDLFVEVLAGTDGQHLIPLEPLLALNRTGAEAGFTNPFSAIYTVPGMAAGQAAVVTYIGFQGTSAAMAVASSGLHYSTAPVALTESPTPPNEVLLGRDTILIDTPEPSTCTLLILGAIGVISWRYSMSATV